jgi:plasmid stabilization system protein ParE
VIYGLEIREEALSDIEEAVQWYEKQRPALGVDFARTVLAAIESLTANPLRHRLRGRRRNVRWLKSRRFPYRVVYQVSEEVITVFAVLHSARHDRHWKRRL